MKILVFTTDIIPFAGLPTSGTALRTFGIIQGLRAHGHEVLVSVPKSALEGFEKSVDISSFDEERRKEFELLKQLAFDAANQSAILSDVGPDIIICGHWPAMTFKTKPSQALVVDLAGPHMLERHYQEAPNQHGAMLGKLGVLANSDYYIVSGDKQRLYFLSYLQRAAVERPESRIVKITMPLDPNQPTAKEKSADAYPNFVFGGVFLPWQNPSAGLRQLGETLSEKNKGQLTLIGGKHPNYKIKEGIYAELFSELSANPRVTTKPMLPYSEFIDELCSVDVALDLMEWNLERELAVTIRSTSYLWAGLPVIYNDYADLASHIREYNAGWCVEPGNKKALAEVFTEIFENPEIVKQKSAQASLLAKELFSWDRAVQPLLSFLGTPETKRLRETDIAYDFPDSAELPVYKNQAVEQYFLCRIDGLTRVECRLATHNQANAHPITLALFEMDGAIARDGKLIDYGTPKLIAREELKGQSLQNNDWCAIDTAPVTNSAGRTFLLKIESDQGKLKDNVSPWAVKGSPYPLLGLRYGANQIDHSSLCFRTTCAGAQ